MEQQEGNPEGNALGAGVTEDALQKAIELSGYPLQSTATDIILNALKGGKRRCSAQEEWAFVDDEEGASRQIDSLITCKLPNPRASRDEHDPPLRPESYLRCSAEFLVECKQSDLPYVFFLRESDVGLIPRIAGLPHEEIAVGFREGRGRRLVATTRLRVSDAVGVHDLPFRDEPPTAIAVSKVQRRSGNALELSGEEPYRHLALPLSKALRHYVKDVRPPEYRMYFDLRIIFPVAVLRAPMIGVRMKDDKVNMTAMPWIRLVRMEPGKGDYFMRQSGATALDVVHVDFLAPYTRQALKAAQEVANRLIKLASPIITGEAIFPYQPQAVTKEGQSPHSEVRFHDVLKPKMTRPEFSEWVDRRFEEVHKQIEALRSGKSSPSPPD